MSFGFKHGTPIDTDIMFDAYINPIIRGFACNNQNLYISVIECHGLDYINITKKAAMELDWYLMNRLGWFERYQYALAH